MCFARVVNLPSGNDLTNSCMLSASIRVCIAELARTQPAGGEKFVQASGADAERDFRFCHSVKNLHGVILMAVLAFATKQAKGADCHEAQHSDECTMRRLNL